MLIWMRWSYPGIISGYVWVTSERTHLSAVHPYDFWVSTAGRYLGLEPVCGLKYTLVDWD